ncbi:MAG: hypothetical protein RJA10_69 [Pseudomonadota bacterium]
MTAGRRAATLHLKRDAPLSKPARAQAYCPAVPAHPRAGRALDLRCWLSVPVAGLAPASRPAWVLLAAAAAALLPAAPAVAQGQGQGQAPLPPVLLPGPAEPDTFTLTQVQVTGGRSVPASELQALAAPYLNRPLRLLDVEDLRQRLNRELVARGLVNSGVVLAPDAVPALAGGTLRLQLIEGQVTELRQQGLGGLSPQYLRSRLLRPGETLQLPELQARFAALLADPLVGQLDARLLPGAALGQSTLEVDLKRAPPVQLSLFANNQGAPSVGSTIAGAELRLLGLTGWGDQFTAVLSRNGGGEQHDLAWTLPLAARSTTLQLRGARNRSSVVEEPLASLGIASRVDTQEATLSHPLLDRAAVRVQVGLAWSRRDSRTTLDGEPFSFNPGEADGHTRVHSWRLVQDGTWRDERRVLALRSTFSFGRHGGATDGTVPGQPRRDYRLWLGQAQASLPLGDSASQLLLRGTLQHSGHALVPLEQLGLGGRHTVRGFRENTLVRDRGWAVSAEGQFPLLGGDGARRRLQGVGFVDAAEGRNVGGPAQRLASAGLGLRGQFDDWEADLYIARRLERRPIDTHGDLQDHGIHLSVRWRAF